MSGLGIDGSASLAPKLQNLKIEARKSRHEEIEAEVSRRPRLTLNPKPSSNEEGSRRDG